MKNLESFGVYELKNKELKTINGGVLGPIVATLALTGAAMKWAWDLGREAAR